MRNRVQSIGRLVKLLVCCFPLTLAGVWQAMAAPTILSSVPANNATGVSPATTLVLNFSEAMSAAATTIMIYDGAQLVTASTTWNSGNTTATCTPAAALPGNQLILWVVTGESATGVSLAGNPYGMFTTVSAGTGCDTNAAMLSFTVSKSQMFQQSSAGAPTLNPDAAYDFLACMSLPCPRDATNISLQLPGGAISNLVLAYPGHLIKPDISSASLSALDTTYPAGNYTFTIQAADSNQTVVLNYPSSLAPPPAPHLANYAAGQAINPNQPFVLAWDPLANGTANDVIYVEIYGGYFNTPALGSAGSLNGLATQVTIPAGILAPGQAYSGCVTFYHCVLTTNGTEYLTLAYRAAVTEFDLHTGSGNTPLVLTPTGWTAGSFCFEAACTNGQALIAESTTSLNPPQWTTLYATNSQSSRVRFGDPRATTNRQVFYRVRTP